MIDNAQPTRNGADSGSWSGAIRQILNKFLAQSIDDMLPARVISYDNVTNMARVQPLIMLRASNQQCLSRGQLTVPVFNIGGGGAVLRFNLVPGDIGWVKANDRDISNFIQSLEEASPNTNRKHKFDDALFFADKMRQYSVQDEEGALAVLQTTDGSIRMVMTDTGFKIKGNLDVDGAVSATGVITSDVDCVGDGVSLVEHDHDYIDDSTTRVTAAPNS